MSTERVVRGLFAGLTSSWVGGAIDVKRMKEGGEGVADVVGTTAVICTVCVFASEYLDMPFMVPVILSGLARARHEAIEFSQKLAEKIRGVRE